MCSSFAEVRCSTYAVGAHASQKTEGTQQAWREILGDPDAKLHIYGKAEARTGRKMGYVRKVLKR